MYGWTVEDKKKILKILNKHGTSNYYTIQRHMPEKTIDDIKAFCEFYVRKATKKWKVTKAKKGSDAAIRDWLFVFKRVNSSQTGYLRDILPRVLKYIALFEKTNAKTPINLNECYMFLSHISAGYSPKRIEKSNLCFLYECLMTLARTAKTSGAIPLIKYLKYLTVLKVYMNKQGILRSKLKPNRSSVVNPLSVPEYMLKMFDFERKGPQFE